MLPRLFALATLLASPLSAATIFDELALSPDASDLPGSPTPLGPLVPGNNEITLSVGNGDTDYLTLEVPPGFRLSALYLTFFDFGLNPGNVGFIGYQDGPVITPDFPAPADIAYYLYGSADVSSPGTPLDLLDRLQTTSAVTNPADFGGSLPAGTYTVWVNETADIPTVSSFSLLVEPVPEPASPALLTLGLLSALAIRRRT